MAGLREKCLLFNFSLMLSDARCSAATYSVGRPGDVSWFRWLTDCLSFPLFIIPSLRLNNSRPYFFRWVSPPSLNYSGQTEHSHTGVCPSLMMFNAALLFWVLLLLKKYSFFFLHTFLVMGWVGGLMQEVIRLKNVLKLLKNMYTLKWPHGTPQNICVFLFLTLEMKEKQLWKIFANKSNFH